MEQFKEKLSNFVKKFEEAAKSFVDLNKTDPGIINVIKVTTDYGVQDIKKLASVVSSSDGSRALRITPFDASNLKAISKALWDAQLGNVSEGKTEIILTLSPITDEYKQKALKGLKDSAEKTRVMIRQERQDFLNKLKKEIKSENELENMKKKVEDVVKTFITKVDEMINKLTK